MIERKKVSFTAAALTALVLTGCAASAPAPAPGAAPGAVAAKKNADLIADPTANDLHDIAGKLLLYFASHRELPAELEDAAPDAVDPASGQPYVYNPQATPLKGLHGKPLVYQAVPTAPGGRWALLVNDVAADKHLVTYVERVPEAALRGQR
jgi:hypothetical protein